MSTIRHHRHGRIAPLWALAALSMMGTALVLPAHPWLVWNATASAPVGLYRLSSDAPKQGDFALAEAPASARELAAERGYLPADVPLVKRIAAATGDTVCAETDRILINGALVTRRLVTDGKRRALPAWTGCRTLGKDDVFLLMASVPTSFDGRYFGVTRRASLIGKLVPIWTD
jgi:conjugative transfer signal peptidase TraF